MSVVSQGIVSRLPCHSGDGFSWGGDVLVTFGKMSINLGCGVEAENLARLISAVPQLLEACRAAKEFLVPDLKEPGRTVFWKLVDAIATATGEDAQ